MATLTKKKVNLGLYTNAANPTFAMKNIATLDATAETGDQYVNDPLTYLRFKNTGATVTVNIACQRKIRGLLRHIRFTVASGQDVPVPPLPAEYSDDNGFVQITYVSGWQSGLTVAAIRNSEDIFEEAAA